MIQTLGLVTPAALDEIAEEKRVRKTDELFVLFSLGSQFDHLIKQHLDKLGVFCLVADPAAVRAEDVKRLAPRGIILSGGPASAHIDQPAFDTAIFDLGIPVLGICLGFQVWAHYVGAQVASASQREFGTHVVTVKNSDTELFAGLPD